MSRVDIAALRSMLASATPGPWWVSASRTGVVSAEGHWVCKVSQITPCTDLESIVGAVNSLPALLDELERWRAICDAADELDRASVVLGADINANSKRRFFDAIGSLCDAVEAVRSAK